MEEQFGSEVRRGDVVFAMGIDIPAVVVDSEFAEGDTIVTLVLELPNGAVIFVGQDDVVLAPAA